MRSKARHGWSSVRRGCGCTARANHGSTLRMTDYCVMHVCGLSCRILCACHTGSGCVVPAARCTNIVCASEAGAWLAVGPRHHSECGTNPARPAW